VFRRDRAVGEGGGIVCYIRSDYSCSVIDLCDIPGLTSSGSEFLVIAVKDFNLLLICLYHPFWNNAAADEEAIACLTGIIDFAHLRFGTNLRIVVCGDFNDLRLHLSTIASILQLTPLVDFSTRGSNCLDQILTNFATDSKPTRCPPIGRSDHATVLWRPSPAVRLPTRKLMVRKFSRSNFSRFRCAVSSVDWLGLVKTFADLNEATAILLQCLFLLFDSSFPKRTIRMRASEPKWMKVSLKILIDDRDRAFHKHQVAKYHRLREEVISHIRYLKSKLISASISSRNPANLWKSLRSISGLSSKSRSSAISLSADELCEYFASNFHASCDLSSFLSSSDFASPVLSSTDVHSYLCRVSNKSGGPDNVPSWVLRDFADFLCPAITYLFNKSLSEGFVPVCFKQANVIPIPKCERPANVSDFRPISLLPVLSKVFEKIVVEKFILPIIKDSVDPSQFAYIPRPGSGTTCALVLAYHKILEFLDARSGAVRILSVDFSKAFDKLLHSRLLSACSDFGFPPFLLNWIASFLTSRRQRVFLNGSFSAWSDVSSGVPQGSILGPILFCLAVNNLSPVCSNSVFIKYADDVSVLHFVRDSSDDNLQQEWDNIVSWSSSAMLPINYLKCKVMNVCTNKSLHLSSVSLSGGGFLEEVLSLSFLGVVFSHDLKWNAHVDKILKKACKRIFILINLRRSACPKDLMFQSYSVFIRSVLLYAYPVWCNTPSYLTRKLSAVERRALRIIGSPSSQFPSLFDVADNTCKKLMYSIEACDDHPLSALFNRRTFRHARCSRRYTAPHTKTVRLGNSFIKYSK